MDSTIEDLLNTFDPEHKDRKEQLKAHLETELEVVETFNTMGLNADAFRLGFNFREEPPLSVPLGCVRFIPGFSEALEDGAIFELRPGLLVLLSRASLHYAFGKEEAVEGLKAIGRFFANDDAEWAPEEETAGVSLFSTGVYSPVVDGLAVSLLQGQMYLIFNVDTLWPEMVLAILSRMAVWNQDSLN